MVSYTVIHYRKVEALSIYFVLFSARNAEMIFTVISLVFSCEYNPACFLASLHIALPAHAFATFSVFFGHPQSRNPTILLKCMISELSSNILDVV